MLERGVGASQADEISFSIVVEPSLHCSFIRVCLAALFYHLTSAPITTLYRATINAKTGVLTRNDDNNEYRIQTPLLVTVYFLSAWLVIGGIFEKRSSRDNSQVINSRLF